MYRLLYGVQNYEWGKLGKEALIANLFATTNNVAVEEKPYAEIWMGTHPSLPSKVVVDGKLVSLPEFLNENPSALGKETAEQKTAGLPYLFKILSINKALSIQAHPDLERAKRLFEKKPDLYKDPNHKPEMAVALTPFECFCNFCPKSQIIANLTAYKPVTDLIPIEYLKDLDLAEENSEPAKASLKLILGTIVDLANEVVKTTVDAMLEDISKKSELTVRDKLVKRLHQQFPHDVGIIMSLLLNYTELKPFEAVVLHPNEPHSYLFGECVEIMANSDNVVRLGLTPKAKDKETLLEMLTYETKSVGSQTGEELLAPHKYVKEHRVYKTPYGFNVVKGVLDSKIDKGDRLVFKFEGPSVLIVVKGKGLIQYGNPEEADKLQILDVKFGDSCFATANTSFFFELSSEVEENLEFYIAF